MEKLELITDNKRQILDITEDIQEMLPSNSGLINIFVKHTTAAVTAADLDPGTDLDILDALDGLLPDIKWRHPHDPAHAPDHILSALVGPSLSVPFKDGKLIVGDWQRIILIEFDGPRTRSVQLSIINI